MVLPKEVRSNHDVWCLQVFDNCGMFNLCTHSSSTCLCLVQHSISPSFDPTVHPLLVRDQQSTVLNSAAIHLVLILFINFQTYPFLLSYLLLFSHNNSIPILYLWISEMLVFFCFSPSPESYSLYSNSSF